MPISVTAIGGETIKDNNISNLNDLSLYTPNVKLQAVAPFGRINMRGLGSGTNRGFEQSVGLVIDGVFFARLQYLLDAMLDLERVEALRGPQGTLFGKNTIAGALNIASGTPEPDFRAEGDITVGEYEQQRLRVMATGPIDKNGDLMFRIAATRDRKDGHNYNTFLQRDESNTQNDAVRGKLRWEPTPDIDLTAGVTWSNFNQRTWGIQFTELAGDMAPIYALFDPNLEDDPNNYEGQADHPGYNTRETWIGGLTANWELPGEWILTSVTGYSNYLEVGDIDADGGPMPYITLAATEDYTQWSEEIRVASPPGDIEFVAGLYWFYSDTQVNTHVGILPVDDPNGDVAQVLLPQALDSLLGPATAALLGPLSQPDGVESADLAFDQTSTSYAAFGQANWHLAEDWTLVVGARYTMEEKEVVQSQVLNGAGIITQGVAGWEAYDFADTRKEYSFSPKLSVQYRYDDDLMAYFTWAKGFKGGGYNASASKNAELEYEPENALTYEIGVKSEFLDGAARANVSLFYTEFRDLQVSVFTTSQFVVRNAADAVTQGVEFEFMMVPMEGLMLMASGAYTDAHFTSFPQGTCTVEDGGDYCDLSGQRLQRAPEWTGNFSANYLNTLGSLPFDLVVGTDLLYQDEFFLAVDGDPHEQQEAYLQVNARIGLRADDEAWSFMVFGRNLTDEVVMVTAADAPLADFSHFAVMEPPRTVSAEFTVRF